MVEQHAAGEGQYLLWCCVCCVAISVVCGSVQLTTNQTEVLIVEDQSTILPAGYRLTGKPPSFLVITWSFGSTTVIVKTVQFSEGGGVEKTQKEFVPTQYKGRVFVFPGNGSLLLRNVSQRDAGTYNLTVKAANSGTQNSVVIKLTFQPAEAPSIVCGSVQLTTNQTEVLIVEDQSTILPAGYRLTGKPPSFLVITWSFGSTTVIVKTVQFSEGGGVEKTQKEFVPTQYKGRVFVFPGNGSLLLRNVSQRDAGTYNLTVKADNSGTQNSVVIKLTFQPAEGPSFQESLLNETSNGTSPSGCSDFLSNKNPINLIIVLRTVSLGISFIVLVLVSLITKLMTYQGKNLF